MAQGIHKMRLGRSLASLIGEGEGSEFEVEGQRNVALDAIKAGRFNPRRNFSEVQIEELAVSIRERGLVQPLVVRPVRGELRMDFETSIAQLPDGARAIFVMHDVEGYTHEEIAAQMGITTGTTKAQLHRARMLLRRSLEA